MFCWRAGGADPGPFTGIAPLLEDNLRVLGAYGAPLWDAPRLGGRDATPGGPALEASSDRGVRLGSDGPDTDSGAADFACNNPASSLACMDGGGRIHMLLGHGAVELEWGCRPSVGGWRQTQMRRWRSADASALRLLAQQLA